MVGIGSQIGSTIAPLIIIPIAAAYGWRITFCECCNRVGVDYRFAIFGSRIFLRKCAVFCQERNYIRKTAGIRNGHQLVTMKRFLRTALWLVMCMYFCLQWSDYFLLHGCPFTCRKEGIF